MGRDPERPAHVQRRRTGRRPAADGSLLTVRDWTRLLGKGSEGPLLKTFPLTRAQRRELALKPQLLP
ncbi:hypothetical protein [Streptomyces sp. NPDC004008]